MGTSARLLWGLVALSLAPQVSAQARERTVCYCTNCINQRAISDVDLHGALAKKDVEVGTDFIVIDGPQNTSLVYQATVVASLDHPRSRTDRWPMAGSGS